MKKKDYIFTAIFTVIVCIITALILNKGVTVNVRYNGEAAPSQSTTLPTAAPTDAPTEAPTAAPSTNDGTTAAPVTDPTDSAQKDEGGLPKDNAAILAKYSDLMNKANELKVGFNKVEYQAIPEEKANLGGILDKIMPIASTFFVDEETAKSKPENFPKGGDMAWFPLYHTTKGCVLTDVSKIEKAECKKLDDGNVKIIIELADEMNPEPIEAGATSCSSHIGAMFNPIKRADVDDVLQNNVAVKFLIKNLDYDLNYYDCTVELIYNPETDQIVSADLFMHILIIVNSGKVAGSDVTGDAVLDNTMHLTEFVY